MSEEVVTLSDSRRALPLGVVERGKESPGYSTAPTTEAFALQDDVSADPAAGCSVAVLIPCYNESLTIGKVVRDFRCALPAAKIYVFDNNSRDGSAQIAAAAGAAVRRETMQGKGHVVRRMFRDIDADLYVLVDGDDTYDASAAPLMVATALSGPFDLVNGARVEDERSNSYRRGHRVGNQVLTGMVLKSFGDRTVDVLSGYKVLSRRFVKSFPVLSAGFEVETELTVHALQLDMPVTHVNTKYRSRPEGSTSKLNTLRDGWRILRLIVELLKQERPMLFFSVLGVVLVTVATILAAPIIVEFFQTHTVPRLPTAVLVMGMMMLAFLSFTCGIILDTVTRGRHEAKLLRYLSIPYVDRFDAADAWLFQHGAADSAAVPRERVEGAMATRAPHGGSRTWKGLAVAAVLALLAAVMLAALGVIGIVQFTLPVSW